MNPLIYTENNANSPIIIALDYNSEAEALNLIKKLDPNLCKLKVGKELFVATGPKFIEKLVISGFKVFLDLKFHDIPNTVYSACKVASNLGVWMLNVHASGGEEMLQAAKTAIDEVAITLPKHSRPLLIAVTMLTSMTQSDLDGLQIPKDITKHTFDLAQLSFKCGLDGVVCSALEANTIKNVCTKDFLTITPGIRLLESNTDDQKRIMTPKSAIENGADYLVIGRPITQANNPTQKLHDILHQVNFFKNQ